MYRGSQVDTSGLKTFLQVADLDVSMIDLEIPKRVMVQLKTRLREERGEGGTAAQKNKGFARALQEFQGWARQVSC